MLEFEENEFPQNIHPFSTRIIPLVDMQDRAAFRQTQQFKQDRLASAKLLKIAYNKLAKTGKSPFDI